MDKRLAATLQKYNVPDAVCVLLVEFSISYLKETPLSTADFGIQFFLKKQAEVKAKDLKRLETSKRPNPTATTRKSVDTGCVFSERGIYLDENMLEKAKTLMSKVKIFKYLTEKELNELTQKLVRIEFPNGQMIFRTGDEICGILMVEEGEIKMTLSEKISPKEVVFTNKMSLKAGDHTDVLSLICYKPSVFTAFSKGDLRVLFLDVKSFEEVVGRCSFFLHRAQKRHEWENYILGNPYLYMLRYELRNFLLCYIVQKPANVLEFGLDYFYEMKETPGTINLVQKESAQKGKIKVRHPGLSPREEESDGKRFPKYAKSTEQRAKIRATLMKIGAFTALEEDDVKIILDSVKKRKVQSGEVVIKQGEPGDCMYVIESGKYEAKMTRSGETRIFKTYEDSGFFGELSLLYRTPRKATVTAMSDGVLWKLSKEIFNQIVIENVSLKQKMFENLLEEVPLLKSLNAEERNELADSLVTLRYAPGDVIVRENEDGDGMFFVISGRVGIQKNIKGKNVDIAIVKNGGYFGELSLVADQPRAATAIAVDEVLTAFLDIRDFERILGPRKNILKRNIDLYKNQILSIISQMK